MRGKKQKRILRELWEFHPRRHSNATAHVPEKPALVGLALGDELDQVTYRGPTQPILASDPMIYTTKLVMTVQWEQPNRILRHFQGITATKETDGKFTSQRAYLFSLTNRRCPSHKDLDMPSWGSRIAFSITCSKVCVHSPVIVPVHLCWCLDMRFLHVQTMGWQSHQPTEKHGKEKKNAAIFFTHQFRKNDIVSAPAALEKVGKV